MTAAKTWLVSWPAIMALLCTGLIAGAGCSNTETVVCDNGVRCPSGMVCVEEFRVCGAPDQVAACSGLAEGEGCSYGQVSDGICNQGMCAFSSCGDEILDPLEACDDGNRVSGDGCSADCLSNEMCGNGIIDENEDCDCGNGKDGTPGPECNDRLNSAAGGLCNTDCKQHCGDNKVSAEEECDGTIPAQLFCTNRGFDFGRPDCSSCSVSFQGCRLLGISPMVIPRPATIMAVWGTSDKDIYAVGQTLVPPIESALWRFNGFAWSEISVSGSNVLNAVWGADSSNVVAVGQGGTILHLQGTEWTQVPNISSDINFNAVWGSSPTDIHAVADGGVIFHYDGSGWFETMGVPTEAPLYAVWGANASTVYAAGDSIVLQFDGTSWEEVAEITVTGELTGIWGSSANDVYIVGLNGEDGLEAGVMVHKNGQSWGEPVLMTPELATIWGDDPDNIFIVGPGGLFMHYDGDGWTELPSSTSKRLNSIWGSDSSDIFVAGSDSNLLRYEGMRMIDLTGLPPAMTVEGIWGMDEGGLVAVGKDYEVWSYDGTAWSAEDLPIVDSPPRQPLDPIFQDPDLPIDPRPVAGFERVESPFEQRDPVYEDFDAVITLPKETIPRVVTLSDIWGAPNGELFVTGYGEILHRDVDVNGNADSSWTAFQLPVSPSFLAVWGTDASNVVAGGVGVILRYNGTWVEEDIPAEVPGSQIIKGIWGSSASSIYAVGNLGPYVLRYNGAEWETEDLPTTLPPNVVLNDVWGSGPDNIVAVGNWGTIVHYNGTEWTAVENPPTFNSLHRVWGSGAEDIFAVGDAGTLLHYDGETWAPIRSNTQVELRAGWCSDSRSIYFAGKSGSVRAVTRTEEVSSGPATQ